MPGPVVAGSLLKCVQGTAPTPLSVIPIDIVNGDAPIATVMDFKPGANIVPFGTCNILTSSASGVPTPCAPAPAGPWQPGAIVVKIGNFAALTDACQLVCGVGGSISVSKSMQVSVPITIE